MGHGFGIEEEHRQTTWHIVNDIEFSNDSVLQIATNSAGGREGTYIYIYCHLICRLLEVRLTLPFTESVTEVFMPGMPTSPQEKGKAMLSTTAARVWSILMASKKSTVEEIFKVDMKHRLILIVCCEFNYLNVDDCLL